MKVFPINCVVHITSALLVSAIIAQPAQATTLNGSFSFMGNSTYLENDATKDGCIDEAQKKGVPKLDMVTINAVFSIKKDPFSAKDSFIKFTWQDSNCDSADQEYDNFNGQGKPWMSKKIPLTDKTKLDPETWKVERIDFSGVLEDEFGETSSGYFDFKTNDKIKGETETFFGGAKVDTTTVFKISDFESKKECIIDKGAKLLSYKNYAPFTQEEHQKMYIQKALRPKYLTQEHFLTWS